MPTEREARFWNRTAHRYARSDVTDPQGYARTLARTRALLAPSDRVLELGCGTGTTALRLADAVADYLATDISTEMIAIAGTKLAAAPVPGLTFQAGTVETFAGQQEAFNAVLGFNYLHLVRDLPQTLRHIHAMLAPGGLFMSKTPCLSDMNLLIRALLIPALRAIGKAPPVNAFRAADLARYLGAVGFDIIATEDHATGRPEARPYIVARRR